jgi:hypothetical protein
VTAPTPDSIAAEIVTFGQAQYAAGQEQQRQADQQGIASLQAQLAAADAQIEALEAQLAALSRMEFGSYNNQGGNTAASLVALTGLTGLGNIRRRRSFASNLPAWAKHAAAQDAAAGLASFASVKPPNGDAAGVAAGKYDAQIQAFVTGAPAGTLVTMYHEPEDNLSQASYAAMITRFASIAKAANHGVSVGYVAMAYQWGHGRAYSTFDPVAAGLDWLAIDVYADYSSIGADASTPLQALKGFAAWYAWASKTGLPLRVAEIGIHSTAVDAKGTHVFTDAQRAAWLGAALDWLQQAGFKSVSYWNSDAGTNPAGVEWSIAGGVPSPLTAAAWRARQ